MNTINTANRLLTLLSVLVLILFGATACSSGSGTDSGSEINTALFSSGTIGPDGTFSYTFANEGTVEYYCDIHAPDMQGAVTVASGAEISGRDTVEMINTQFVPAQLTVAPNTEIVWINRDATAHTVVEGNPGNNDGDGGDGGGGGY